MKVLVYPIPTDFNPYQSLLYKELKKREDITITFLHNTLLFKRYKINLFVFPFQLMYYRLKGYKVFHLHWLYCFNVPFGGTIARYLNFISSLFSLLYLKALGFKLVYTVHNLMPHEPSTINDIFIMKMLFALSDADIIHSSAVLKQMVAEHVKTDNTHLVPHGNYIGFYKNTITQRDARNALHISSNSQLTILFFGMIRRYKGIENLLEAYRKIDNKHITLIIAGHCFEKNMRDALETFAKEYKESVHLTLKHISNDDVQIYFNAADMVVFPYKKVTTSGAAVLALSFGKPIIAPRIGALTDIPETSGIFYNVEDARGLERSIEKAVHEKNMSQMGKNTYEYAQSLSWDTIANKTYDVYKQL